MLDLVCVSVDVLHTTSVEFGDAPMMQIRFCPAAKNGPVVSVLCVYEWYGTAYLHTGKVGGKRKRGPDYAIAIAHSTVPFLLHGLTRLSVVSCRGERESCRNGSWSFLLFWIWSLCRNLLLLQQQLLDGRILRRYSEYSSIHRCRQTHTQSTWCAKIYLGEKTPRIACLHENAQPHEIEFELQSSSVNGCLHWLRLRSANVHVFVPCIHLTCGQIFYLRIARGLREDCTSFLITHTHCTRALNIDMSWTNAKDEEQLWCPIRHCNRRPDAQNLPENVDPIHANRFLIVG